MVPTELADGKSRVLNQVVDRRQAAPIAIAQPHLIHTAELPPGLEPCRLRPHAPGPQIVLERGQVKRDLVVQPPIAPAAQHEIAEPAEEGAHLSHGRGPATG